MEKEKEEHRLFAEVKKNKIRKRRARFENIWSEDENRRKRSNIWRRKMIGQQRRRRTKKEKTHFVAVG